MSKKEMVYYDEREQCYRIAPDVDTIIQANERLRLENDKLRLIL